jgi:hypothetical protein
MLAGVGTQSVLDVVLTLWGLLWGCSFKILVVNSGMLGNVEQMDPHEGRLQASAKLAAVSKITQCVGTVGNTVSGCLLMDLACC